MRVFLDTNVQVSAFATRGLCADVLRLVLAEHEQGNLARLGRRYPRIATQVLSNLSEVLAERLVKTTSRLR